VGLDFFPPFFSSFSPALGENRAAAFAQKVSRFSNHENTRDSHLLALLEQLCSLKGGEMAENNDC